MFGLYSVLLAFLTRRALLVGLIRRLQCFILHNLGFDGFFRDMFDEQGP